MNLARVGAATGALATDFVASGAGKILIVGCVALAVAGLSVLAFVALGKQEARLERRLAGYEPIGDVATTSEKESDLDLTPESRVVTSAVEMTRGIAARAGVLTRVEQMLEQGDIPIRPAEFLFYVPAVAFVVGLLFAFTVDPLTGLLLGALAVAVPFGYVSMRRRKRLHAFEDQLPDALQLLAGTMRSGYSFVQGLEAVARESAVPTDREFQRVYNEARLGRSIEDALGDCAERMSSGDLEWVVMAIAIQYEVGGNLAELLDVVADTMKKRERFRRELRALTAEGRFSAIILSLMPVFFVLLFMVLRPGYVNALFSSLFGLIAVVVAGIGNVIGWFWLRKVVTIEV